MSWQVETARRRLVNRAQSNPDEVRPDLASDLEVSVDLIANRELTASANAELDLVDQVSMSV